MVAKELRENWLKVAIGLGVVVFNIVLFLDSYSYVSQHMLFYGGGGRDEFVLLNLTDTIFTGLGGALVITAIAIGAGSVCQEVRNNTVLMLLSSPLGRSRVLLVKYGVGALCLLSVAMIGMSFFWGSGFVLGYPMRDMDYLLSLRDGALLWLASLVVLGISMLVSILMRSVLASVAVSSALAILVFFFGPLLIALGEFFYSFTGIEIIRGIGTFDYESTFLEFVQNQLFLAGHILPRFGAEVSGAGIWATNFSVLLLAIAVPLLAALWVFGRKEY